jgi:hypothetical protein
MPTSEVLMDKYIGKTDEAGLQKLLGQGHSEKPDSLQEFLLGFLTYRTD